LQDYHAEKKILTKDPVDDGTLVFSSPSLTRVAANEGAAELVAAE
jgi:hypothetical protein